MSNLVKSLREAAKPYRDLVGIDNKPTLLEVAANEIEKLSSKVTESNARERKAFMAGVEAVQHGADFHDEEEAWQQYRCQDDADWVVIQET